MDIEYQQGGDNSKNRSNSLNGHRVSMKSRKSNESFCSIGGTHYYEYPSTEAQKYYYLKSRMSLESNISGKAREKYNNRDLFENLTFEQAYMEEMRQQGSLRPRNRNTQGEKVETVGEGKMSVQVDMIKREPVEISCKCPKSKCLLMYCECFSRDTQCNQKCSCYQCRNNPDFEDKRQKARKAVLQKDPNAFTNKLQLIGGEQSELALKKGCNCKKTSCSKKYCECFFTGVKCTYLCNCQNCMNGGINTVKPT